MLIRENITTTNNTQSCVAVRRVCNPASDQLAGKYAGVVADVTRPRAFHGAPKYYAPDTAVEVVFKVCVTPQTTCGNSVGNAPLRGTYISTLKDDHPWASYLLTINSRTYTAST